MDLSFGVWIILSGLVALHIPVIVCYCATQSASLSTPCASMPLHFKDCPCLGPSSSVISQSACSGLPMLPSRSWPVLSFAPLSTSSSVPFITVGWQDFPGNTTFWFHEHPGFVGLWHVKQIACRGLNVKSPEKCPRNPAEKGEVLISTEDSLHKM